MESSPASYLHKKFKKQLSVEPTRALLLAAQQQQQPYGGEVADSEEARGGPKENRRDHAGECNNGNSGNSGGHGRSAATAAAATDNQTRPRDNNDASVPNQSTKNNQSSSFALSGSTSSISTSKSSISSTACCTAANLQSANSCISSYVVSSNYASFSRPTLAAAAATTTTGTSSFDGGCGNAAFSIKPEPEGPATTSSILHSFYSSNRPVFAARVYEGGGTDIPSASSVNIGANSGGGVRLSPEKEQPGPFQEAALQEETQPPPDKNGNGGGGGKYVCPYCNLVCSKPSVLQKHIRAHTNERPFPCNSCGFSFKTRSNLYKHCRSRTHANRVMGNKAQAQPEPNGGDSVSDEPRSPPSMPNNSSEAAQAKPYKPRFHTAKLLKENNQQELLQQQQQQQYSQEKAASEEAMLHASSDLLSHHINEIISKNNSIVNSSDPYLLKKHRSSVDGVDHVEYVQQQRGGYMAAADEPLNLTNKNRKRCMSEVVEPVAQKSIIKQLLLKNLSSDMQCPHCKMIFQTVTELELHKLRSCKGFVKPGAKYTRSSSVNVASILTQNKNAFDNIPHLQNAAFPLKSPGPFLGKTRLVESDKSKSFSFDDGMPAAFAMQPSSDRYLSLSPLTLQSDKEKKAVPVKLFGGEVKITHSSGETKSFRIENKDQGDAHFAEYGVKMSENRVVKSQLQSGGTVLTNTNKANYGGGLQDSCLGHEVMRGYDEAPGSPGIDVVGLGQGHKSRFDRLPADGELSQLMRTPQQSQQLDMSGGFSSAASPSYKYANIMDFSQKSVKLLTPNLKQPVPAANRFTFGAAAAAALSPIPPDSMGKPNLNLAAKDNPGRRESSSSPYSPGLGKFFPHQQQQTTTTSTPTPSITTVAKIVTPQSPNLYNPMNLLVNGKVVRYVPGIPGPVAAEEPMDVAYVASNNIRSGIVSITAAVRKNGEDRGLGTPKPVFLQPPPEKPPKAEKAVEGVRSKEVSSSTTNEIKPPPSIIVPAEPKKFARPNSLALKPTTASLKQHHGLTPTMFNQILISPDTPRVAKKYVQQFLHGNYFSYLGLKCSTKPVYCTLNKTQPFYVPHFKKLSMYSEWRQQDTRQDRLYVSAYDSRQRQPRYTTAGRAAADLIVHSSYKFVATESHSAKGEKGEDQQKGSTILGGYECNDDYTYIRGRGRGRYVCDQCGIRCKKPSMLKKHIRTHSNDRPYTCNHCNFSFKTKGNLTKHMKSKAHTKNYVAGGSSSSSTQQSGTQSSESDTDESGMESSDESTRREEHEAAYGLLSLAQKSSAVSVGSDLPGGNGRRRGAHSPSATAAASSGMNSEEIAYVFKSNYARNKILDDGRSLGGGGTGGGGNPKSFSEMMIAATVTVTSASGEEAEEVRREAQNMLRFLGRRSAKRPLTYPYTSALTDDAGEDGPNGGGGSEQNGGGGGESNPGEPKSIKQFHVIQKYAANALSPKSKSGSATTAVLTNNAMKTEGLARGGKAADPPPNPKVSPQPAVLLVPVLAAPPPAPPAPNSNTNNMQPPVLKVNDVVFDNISHRGHHHAQDARKRKLSISGSGPEDLDYTSGVSKMAKINEGVMDLSMANAVPDLPRTADRVVDSGVEVLRFNDESSAGGSTTDEEIIVDVYSPQAHYSEQDAPAVLPVREYDKESVYKSSEFNGKAHAPKNNGNVLVLGPAPPQNEVNVNFVMAGGPASDQPRVSDEASSDRQLQQQQPQPPPPPALSSYQSSLEQQYDNSAMETLADIATKQVKLEKNTLAKSVASEFLKLATKNEYHPPGEAPRDPSAFSLQSSKDVSDLMTKSEGSKSCNICLKSFSKPSQLRIHMNIHYMERPFRCHSCSVSFRTKGHLQKHERSASHHNKLSSSPALSSSEPRPFKCVDCSIAFRIHGHLAKHLRSKMHIMKLECLAKIPFGLYAELERSNSLLTEINTADGDQCLESLKTLAKKVFLNDPNKLNQASLAAELALDADS